VVSGPAVALVAIAVLLGVARGIFLLLQATAVSDRWGTADYGHLSGLCQPDDAHRRSGAVGGRRAGRPFGGHPAVFTGLAVLTVAAAVLVALTDTELARAHR
jgi:hypothetical protein